MNLAYSNYSINKVLFIIVTFIIFYCRGEGEFYSTFFIKVFDEDVPEKQCLNKLVENYK